MRELGALYAAFARGPPVAAAGAAVQYADFAAWQREWLQGEVLERQLAYWQRAARRRAAAAGAAHRPAASGRAQTPPGRRVPLTLLEAAADRVAELAQASRRHARS